MLEPLVLLGGLITVPMYAYYWVMTSAQIDLMVIDAPIVVYKKTDKNGNPIHTKEEMDAIRESWMRRKKANPDGMKVNLNEFLRKGEDALHDNTKTTEQ